MKIIKVMKHLLYVTLTVLAISCSSEIDNTYIANENHIKKEYSISINELKSYLSEHNNSLTRNFNYDVQPVISDKDTVLYVVNYEDGWEVFSADVRAPRVFAKSDSGKVSETDFSSIPALKILYESFINNVKYLKENPELKVNPTFVDRWETTAIPQKTFDRAKDIKTRSGEYEVLQSHLLQTKWGQGSPWNIRAPYTDETLSEHCLTGCGPVAMAQLLYYLHSQNDIQYTPYSDSYTYKYIPNGNSYIQLSYSDVTFTAPSGNAEAIWGSMPINKYSTGSFEAVSTLMIDMGIASLSEYYPSSTSTYSSDVESALMHRCHLTVFSDNADFDLLSDMIVQENNPAILLIGYRNSSNIWLYGHYVVADAIKEQYSSSNQLISRWVGFNWGYDGQYDNLWLSTDVINWTSNSFYNSISCMIYNYSIESNI